MLPSIGAADSRLAHAKDQDLICLALSAMSTPEFVARNDSKGIPNEKTGMNKDNTSISVIRYSGSAVSSH